MKEEQEILQRRLVQFIVKDVFNTISEDDILTKTSEGWKHKGGILTEGQITVLKKEAKQISQTKVFEILLSEIRYHAKEALNKAQTENDIISAKLLSYFADVVQSKIKKLAEIES